MKEVFMPSMDELYEMQDRGADVYKYILVKAVESLICYGVNYPAAGIFRSAFKYLGENPEIARAVCSMYPEEMIYSEAARNDTKLCLRLMDAKEYVPSGLDHMSKFDSSVLNSSMVLTKVISLLEKELVNNPMYRFEYIGSDISYVKKGAGKLLDDILLRRINEGNIMFVLGEARNQVVRSLINIEPAYAISLPMEYLKKYPTHIPDGSDISVALGIGINNYANRYGISMNAGVEYYGKDILTNPDQDVKRLLRCIKDRR